MIGGVYRDKKGNYRVHFRGDWYQKDENQKPFRKSEFHASRFLGYLNGLYDPDLVKNRYDPSKFKDKTPHQFDKAFEIYHNEKVTDSEWHKWKWWAFRRHLEPFFQDQDFRTIDKVTLEAFKQWLIQKGLKGHTIKNIFTVLHGFLSHFRESLQSFPTFPQLSYQHQRPRKFTEKEIDEVFSFIEPQHQGYFLAIRFYGLRPEEASGLLRKNVNWETKEITIATVYVDGKLKPKTKTMKERVLPIIPEIEEYLRQWSEGEKTNWDNGVRTPGRACHDLVSVKPSSIFVFSTNGWPYTNHIRERLWRLARIEAQAKYGTRHMTLRDLRSSASSRWLKKGMLIQDVAQLLGNSPEVIRSNYSDEVEDKVVNIVRGK